MMRHASERGRGHRDLDPAGVGKTSHRKHAFIDTTPHIPDPLANSTPALHTAIAAFFNPYTFRGQS